MEKGSKIFLTENELKLICIALDDRSDKLTEKALFEKAKEYDDLAERLRIIRRKLKGE